MPSSSSSASPPGSPTYDASSDSPGSTTTVLPSSPPPSSNNPPSTPPRSFSDLARRPPNSTGAGKPPLHILRQANTPFSGGGGDRDRDPGVGKLIPTLKISLLPKPNNNNDDDVGGRGSSVVRKSLFRDDVDDYDFGALADADGSSGTVRGGVLRGFSLLPRKSLFQGTGKFDHFDVWAPKKIARVGVADDKSVVSASGDKENRHVYFVPYKWWKEVKGTELDLVGVLYQGWLATSGALRATSELGSSDIFLAVKKAKGKNEKEEDVLDDDASGKVGVSGGEFALVSSIMWRKVFDERTARSSSVGEVDSAAVYPLKLRLAALRDADSLGIMISKKDNNAELFKRACRIFNADYELMHIWDFSGRLSLLMNDSKSLPRDFHWQAAQQDAAADGQTETMIFFCLSLWG